ncbi:MULTISPECIES: DUF4238 domain-containing protein [Bradyrhizobium]|uniref:DUF4238 domain-containing protein n=1 Tax=Bradyrhizobium elkanii TaxID=29448 RepID=A0A4U6RUA0_BRAEL|nr:MULTISPECIES: DUF4238 domain-containing protein [Bradyrhizobium]MTV16318.1 DUF4238 domain-containing protein [Bradyrhizobium sp. BR2003]TKV77901.1 DUF4238 domain-containing protein [Bradyrhizobium elkanii]
MSEPARHHYIPVFYLKQWARLDGRLCEYSRPYKETKVKRKHPAATAYVDNLYAISGLPSEQVQFVEKQFMQTVDSGAAEALIAMLTPTEPAGGGEPDWMRIIYWARFIYSLSLRNPEQIGIVQRSLDTGSFSVAAATEEEVRRASQAKSKIRVRKLAVPAQFTLPGLINSEVAIRAITDNMLWFTYHVGEANHSLLTSDRPVIMTKGLGGPNGHLAMPISPTAIFFAVRGERMLQRIKAMDTDELVQKVNAGVVLQAVKYVYGMDDSQLRFVSNRLGKKMPTAVLSPFKRKV